MTWKQWRSQSNKQWEKKAAWWLCKHPDCIAEMKQCGRGPWANLPKEAACGMCGTAWRSATMGSSRIDLSAARDRLAAKAAASTPPSKPQVGTKDKSYANVVQAKEKPISVDSDGEEMETEVTVELELTDEYVAIDNLFYMPADLDDDWTAARALEKFLPKRGGADLEKNERALEDQKQLLLLLEKGIATGDKEATAKKIATLEKQVEKGQSSPSVASLAACELEVSKRQFQAAESHRVARVEAAAEKAEQNANRLEAICVEHITAWEKQLEVVRSGRAEREKAWTALGIVLEGRALEVEALVDSKISDAKQRAGETTVDAKPPAPTASVNIELADALAELKQFRLEAEEAAKKSEEERQKLLERLATLENAPQQAANTVRLTETAYNQCNRTVMYTEAELPQLLTAPDAVLKQHLAQLHVNLLAWSQAGQVPITFAQLMAGTPEDQLEVAYQTMQEATGEAIWTRFYGKEQVNRDHFVPYQLGTVLGASLAKAGEKLEQLENADTLKEVAAKQFKGFRKKDDAAKRARTGPYGQ